MHTQVSIKRQIQIYTQKCFRIFSNDKGWKTFISAAIITVLISFVTGTEILDELNVARNGGFAIICACIWIGIFNSIQSVCKERDIIKREHRSGLSITAYISAHLIFEITLSAIEALIVSSIFIATHIFELDFMGVFLPTYLELYITFFLVILAADVLGLMVSSIVKTVTSAMTVMPFVMIVQLIFSGVVFELEGFKNLFSYLTVSKWGVNAFCSIVNVNSFLNMSLNSVETSSYDHTLANLMQCWALLIVFVGIYFAISIVALKSVDKDKR